LPAWLAVMEHVPPDIAVMVLPDTLQTPGVLDVSVTANPESAVAGTVNGLTPQVTFAIAGKVMVCDAVAIWKVCVTAGAARYAEFPGCVAVSEQVPLANIVTCDPLTEHTDGELDE
jgi:hypothetical protein